ncbi:MAG: Asp-tRNA(Asn)/Glu-tRNA(Gln) amidotransferase subunit GatA [Thiopseudomonas sp.]|jgi:aspartyl-tRNA(Asn)/glutamyl-tRNA(Gln) amidotransferase subunit A|nr:Asp-tRNA(Asn)/Glu-tRNA(Gln) amidotransferase subunit GatA [Thiopseudomonas sp.]HAB92669.1 Asp-tRNA(Asn)/Glu-tRNA(Gln) amidotransferase GatCAB subunit A [Pseudomonas sp.]MBP7996908.1 Asp-tRNA(Asn)/Glu-tRNA(Gln) amidotransferase subunit GatA [Thiopseudomonas sp.]MBP8008298.1 Asp-tRNA(Asn)/Glu-tRNA(Gln) amidotransferase subunit GatA [Thiopseudomonas sp.]MBP8770545.1 Asp-tRNA(Asn)/Glu-tRNA(Gln) amidotransferase subunit GatA [Thiopseudomonas sp.]
MHQLTLTDISKALAAKQFSARELTTHLLARIEQLDPQLNSFITVSKESALQQADAADELRSSGINAPLLGLPIAHKDLFCTEGVRTSCASKTLDNFIAPYTATVVDKLNKVGCISLGKLNMDEFAMGSSGETSFYGPSKNPWDTQRIPGGSSSGSAVAVAARLVPASTGSDSGGSIRQPAAFTGLTGIKPTYGRISRWGMTAYASSFDQAGFLAHNAEDCAMLLQATAGFDERDSTSAQQPVDDYAAALSLPLQGLRIGLPKEYFSSDLDGRIGDVVNNSIEQLKQLGATFVDISLPSLPHAVPAYYVIASAEASTNLARFDGVRFGHRCENPQNLEDLYLRSRDEAFGKEVKRRIMIGTYALSTGYYDAYYLKAQKIRRLIKNDFVSAFKDVDLILGPTTPNLPWLIGSKIDDPVAAYLEDIYTVPANLAGIPGLSMPAGMIDGLPVGVQLLAPYFQEARLLQVAHQFQQHTDWHARTPAGF